MIMRMIIVLNCVISISYILQNTLIQHKIWELRTFKNSSQYFVVNSEIEGYLLMSNSITRSTGLFVTSDSTSEDIKIYFSGIIYQFQSAKTKICVSST